MLPRVTILILNYNGWRDTLECLESVFRIDYPNFRVLVCDNGSTDGSLDHLRGWAEGRLTTNPPASPELRRMSEPAVAKPILFGERRGGQIESGAISDSADPPLTLICLDENRGFTGGNNVGLQYLVSRGAAGYVCLLNNDTVIDPLAIRRMVDVGEADASIGAVGATALYYSRPDTVQVAGGGWASLWHGMVRNNGAEARRGHAPVQPLGFVSGCCMLVRLSTISQVGLLDERYFIYADDADWCVRMQQQGFRMAYAPQAELWHKGSNTTVASSPTQDFHMVRSCLLLVRKFRPNRMPAAYAYSLYRCVLPKIVRREWDRLDAVRRAWGDVLALGGRRGRVATPKKVPAVQHGHAD